MNNIYLPEASEILSVEKVTPIEWLFRVKFDKKVKSGQFIQISIPKIGEAPISITEFNVEEVPIGSCRLPTIEELEKYLNSEGV